MLETIVKSSKTFSFWSVWTGTSLEVEVTCNGQHHSKSCMAINIYWDEIHHEMEYQCWSITTETSVPNIITHCFSNCLQCTITILSLLIPNKHSPLHRNSLPSWNNGHTMPLSRLTLIFQDIWCMISSGLFQPQIYSPVATINMIPDWLFQLSL